MKRLIFVLLVFFTLTGAFAQRKSGDFDPERFQADLEQYITRKAGLSPREASHFFPVYSEMLRKQRAVHEKMRNLKRIKPVTKEECKKNIQKRDEYDIEIKQIQKTYHDKFMKILSADKVYEVLKAEDKFHRQAFKRAADRKGKKK